MPHFTVTKVEDPEEGAADPVFPEPSSAEVKARIQDPQEPGESRACNFGDPQTSFREGASNLAISLRTVAHGADGKKACFLVVLLLVYLITLSLFFPTKWFAFSPTKSFLCLLPTGEIESVAMYEKSFQAKRKTVKVIYAEFRIQFSLRQLRFI